MSETQDSKPSSSEIIESLDAMQISNVFTESGRMDAVKNIIETLVDGFEHDLSTQAGRKRTASLARRISTFKTKVDNVGKEMVSEWKTKAKAVDQDRKSFRDSMDKQRDKVRQPLTEWEEAEEHRILSHKNFIESMKDTAYLNNPYYGPDLNEIDQAIESLNGLDLSILEEFQDEGYSVFGECIQNLHRMKELEEDRLEAEEQARIEREAFEAEQEKLRIEREKMEAEQAALRAEKEKLEAAKLEQQRKEEEERRISAAKQEAEQRARDAEERTEQERVAAKKRAQEAAEQARLAEVQRQKEEEAKKEAERLEREANEKHVNQVQTSAINALALIKGISLEKAAVIVNAIDDGQIPGITINY